MPMIPPERPGPGRPGPGWEHVKGPWKVIDEQVEDKHSRVEYSGWHEVPSTATGMATRSISYSVGLTTTETRTIGAELINIKGILNANYSMSTSMALEHVTTEAIVIEIKPGRKGRIRYTINDGRIRVMSERVITSYRGGMFYGSKTEQHNDYQKFEMKMGDTFTEEGKSSTK
eukprot:CAMPEP_0119005478 /NCGR_PEP_ID=MMETSP1176-20130426/1744_1 /TAXON_ID=265551 /ORGANISM="Synedropsis recta cf, Strain CCMP1620" /LENGTH=172 /DNA_ID=CAMNT_0006957291 /DNA_START=1201 /DNA_END=1719 /DNA_ORIENTATION=-